MRAAEFTTPAQRRSPAAQSPATRRALAAGFSTTARLTVANSAIFGNAVTWNGGGILDDTTLTATNSTFYGNIAHEYGGGIDANGTGETITNCTINGNTADDGGGGIWIASGTETLANTIVAGNTYSGSPDISGPVTANYSLIQNTTGATISGSNNILSQSAGLGTVGSYGGPTQTIPLLPGSPAIDSGSVALAVGLPANRSPPTSEAPAIRAPTTAPSIWVAEVQDTATALASSVNPSVCGQPVTFTATVGPLFIPGPLAPTGR